MNQTECIEHINKEINLCDDVTISNLLLQIKNSIENDNFEMILNQNSQLQVLLQNKIYKSNIVNIISEYLVLAKPNFESKSSLNNFNIENKIQNIINTNIDTIVVKIETNLIKYFNKVNEDYYLKTAASFNNSLKILSQELGNNSKNYYKPDIEIFTKKISEQINQIGYTAYNFTKGFKEFKKSITIKNILIQSLITIIFSGVLSYFIVNFTIKNLSNNKSDHEIVENLKIIKNNLTAEEKSCWNKIFPNK